MTRGGAGILRGVGAVVLLVAAARAADARQPEASECARPAPGWIWCDDFESSRLAAYFEVDTARGAFTRTVGAGRDGSWGMRARFTPGAVSVGFLHLALGRTPSPRMRAVGDATRDYRELYWRVWVRHQPGWRGGGGYKLSRAFVMANEVYAQAMIGHVWSGSPPHQHVLVLDPASGTDAAGLLRTTRYNDFPRLRFLGARRGTTPLFAPDRVGRWYCIEARVKLNDAGRVNGEMDLWIDDRPEVNARGLNFLGSFRAFGLNAVYLENYWNAPGSPAAQVRDFDGFVVASERIGCDSTPDRAAPDPVAVEPPVSPAAAPATPSPPPAGGAREGSREPSGFRQVTDRDFAVLARCRDASSRLDRWDDVEACSPTLSVVRDPSAPRSPPGVLEWRYPAGFQAGRSPGTAARSLRGLGLRRLFIRMWVQLGPGWEGHASGTNKIFFVWLNGEPTFFVSAEGRGAGPLEAQLRLQGRLPDARPRLPPNRRPGAQVVRGRWQEWEFLLECTAPGARDGRAQWWIDGTLVSEYRDIAWAAAGRSCAFEEVQLRPVWGGTGGAAPRAMALRLDHLYVSGAP